MTRSIVELFSSKDIELKKKAIFALGELKTKKAVKALTQVAIQETHSEVKISALETLLKIGGIQGLEAMILSLEDIHPVVRAIAVKGIGLMGSSKEIPLIASKLRDKDKTVRAEAVKALYHIGGEEVRQLLNPFLEDLDSHVCVNTVFALHQIASKTMIEILAELLKDRDPRVRKNAVEVLRNIESEQKLELLGKALGDENPEIQEIASEIFQSYRTLPLEQVFSCFKSLNKLAQKNFIELVSRWKNPEVLPFFTQILKQEQDDFLRLSVLEAISEIGNDEAVKVLTDILREKGEPLRMNAAEALRKIASLRVIHGLLDLLRDTSVDGFGKILAVETLELIGDGHVSKAPLKAWKEQTLQLGNQSHQTIPLLKRTLKMELESLMKNLITEETLGSLKNPEITEPLVRFLQEENEQIKQNILKTFEDLDDREPLTGIIKKLKSADRKEQLALLEAMERIDKELTKMILPFLNQSDPYLLKTSMGKLLKQHGRQIEIKNLENLCYSPDEEISLSALLALCDIGSWNLRTGRWNPT